MNKTVFYINSFLAIASLFGLSSIVLFATFYEKNTGVQDVNNDDSAAIAEMCNLDRYPPQSDNGPGELLWFGALFRHGDRTPIFFLDSDPYKDFVWPEGRNMLLNTGRRRMFCLGTVLKRRYANYIKKVHTQHVIANSSWYRRCIESTELVLAGLCPPDLDSSWAPNIKIGQSWNAIGVESREFDRSWMLCGEGKCPKAESITPPKPQFTDEQKAFIEKVIKITDGQISSADELVRLKDTLLIEREYFGKDFKEPAWIQEASNNTWSMLKDIYDVAFASYIQTPEYLRLRTGVFLDHFHKIFLNVTTMPKEPPKIHLFGSHDTTVTWLMQVLDLYTGTADFGSGLVFEIRRINDQQIVVRILYVNSVENYSFRELNISSSKLFADTCSGQAYCDAWKMFKILDDHKMLISDIETQCQL